MTDQSHESSYIGSMGTLLYKIGSKHIRNWSFKNKGKMTSFKWRESARTALLKGLSNGAESVPLDSRVLKTEKFSGYTQQWVDFAGTEDYRITGVLLIPDAGSPPFPSVVGLHDHGGFFYYGKEKITETQNSLPELRAFKGRYYEGRSWASELARRGYVVLVIDALGWGIRNIANPCLQDPFSYQLEIQDEEKLVEINARANNVSGFLDLHTAYTGASWGGIVNWDDRRSVDYLLSRSEVDPRKIACLGLSGGGFRSTYLFASDTRIACAGIVGWMTHLADQLIHNAPCHLGMFNTYYIYREMDHPDVAGLGAPRPLFIQQCAKDQLFPLKSMKESCEYIKEIYTAFRAEANYQYRFYDVPHCFNANMQEDMFNWFDSVLKNCL